MMSFRALPLFFILGFSTPPPAAAVAVTKILFLGDSLTEGLGVAHEAAYPALIDAALKGKGIKDIEVINAGISGSTTASGLSRLKWHLKGEAKPKILVLALGANDGLRGLDLKAMKQNLLDVVRLAKTNGMKVVLAGMQIPPNYGHDYTETFARVFQDLAKAEDLVLIPFLLEGVAGERNLNQADGLHPTEAGHKIIAAIVLKYLEPLLAK